MQIDYVYTQKEKNAPVLNALEQRALRHALHAAYGAAHTHNADARAQLDALAAPYLDHANENNFPQEDYLVLRLSRTYGIEEAQRSAREKALSEEENLIVQTASQVLSVRVLEIYLNHMLKRYRALLQTYKIPARETDVRVQHLTACAVRACLSGLISRRKWALCTGILRHYKNVLGKALLSRCAAAVRAGFAQDKGEQAWQATNGRLTLEERRAGAIALLEEEPDSELKALAQKHTDAIFERAQAQLYRAQSDVYQALADGQNADTAVLEVTEIAPASDAAARAAQDAHAAVPDVFNTLYFKASVRDIQKAWQAHQISARDYLLLMHVYYARKSGFSDENTYALVHALALFCAKNNVPVPAADEAVYAVLHAPQAQQFERAQEMKKIYLLQENAK